jgi:hypothetical protein
MSIICVAVIPAPLNGCTAFVFTGKPSDDEETTLSSVAEIPPSALFSAPADPADALVTAPADGTADDALVTAPAVAADGAEGPQLLTATGPFVLAICHQPPAAAATVPLIAFS